MIKNLKYALLALAFIGMVKVLQVTVFDKTKYTKLRKSPYISSAEKKENARQKAKATNLPGENTFKEEEKTPPPVLDRTAEEPAAESPKTEVKARPTSEKENSASIRELTNGYLAPILAKLPPGQLREDITIRYYRHEEDGDKVYSLKDLGYYIHEKEVSETAGLGSNVLYYGKDVSTEDIRIIAYTLIEQGIPLKSIAPTQYSWKSTSVEIGTDPDLANSKVVNKQEALLFAK